MRQYDFEYAEVRRLAWDSERHEVEMIIDCPEITFLRKERLHRLFLRFLGVSDAKGDLYEYVQKQLLEDAKTVAELLAKGNNLILHLEIDHVRNVKLASGTHRFYLGADDKTFEFSYQSGVFKQLTTLN